MTTLEPTPSLAALVDRLADLHGDRATRAEISDIVRAAWNAVDYFGATDDATMVTLASRIAERDLRLRLGIDRESARLDPERHRSPGSVH